LPFSNRYLTFIPKATDENGNPIVVVNAAAFKAKSVPPQQLQNAICYVMERVLEETHTRNVAQFTTVCNLGGMGVKNFSQQDKSFTDVMNNSYPRLDGLMVCLNTPWYCRVAWKIMTPWLTEQQKQNIRVLQGDGNANRELLVNSVAMRNMPLELGGSLRFDLEDWMEQRAKEEGVELPTAGDEVLIDGALAVVDNSAMSMTGHKDTRFTGVLWKRCVQQECLHFSYATRRTCIIFGASPCSFSHVCHCSHNSLRGGGGMLGSLKWKLRYFCLRIPSGSTQAELLYFTGLEASEPNRSIALDRFAVEEKPCWPASKLKHPHFSFSLVTPGRTYELAARTEEQRKEWMEEIEACAEQATTSM
jgi:hypothetical protein